MYHIFNNMKARLKAFEQFRKVPITFDCLNYSFYEVFVVFMMYEYVQRRYQGRKGLKVNTIGCTIKQFRIFLKNRMLKKIIPPIDLQGWIVLEEEADAVYLSWKEILQIQNVDLSEYPHLVEYRDDTVLACLTGLRFSDFSKLQPSDVRGDMLYKKQQKSNHWVIIPLRPEAKAILDNRFRNEHTPNSNPEFNRHIKTIAKLAGIVEPVTHSYKKGNRTVVETKPKFEWVTSHTCRRSFCTNEFLAGTPVELIMKISGHKSIKAFYRYIRVSPEEAAGKIKEIWEARAAQLTTKSVAAMTLKIN
jgi:integrase